MRQKHKVRETVLTKGVKISIRCQSRLQRRSKFPSTLRRLRRRSKFFSTQRHLNSPPSAAFKILQHPSPGKTHENRSFAHLAEKVYHSVPQYFTFLHLLHFLSFVTSESKSFLQPAQVFHRLQDSRWFSQSDFWLRRKRWLFKDEKYRLPISPTVLNLSTTVANGFYRHLSRIKCLLTTSTNHIPCRLGSTFVITISHQKQKEVFEIRSINDSFLKQNT